VGIRQIDLSEETLALINQLRKMYEAGQVFEDDQRLKHSDELDSMLAQVAHAFGSDVRGPRMTILSDSCCGGMPGR
jgi:hypothetical protein